MDELSGSMSGAEYGDWMALYAIEAEEREGGASEPAAEMDVNEFLRRSGKHG